MKIRNDDVLMHLRSFGFTNEEYTMEGFRRYAKRIGNLLITVANGQFENKLRLSLLQDKNGNVRVSYKDILAYSELICSMQEAGIIGECVQCDETQEMSPYKVGNYLDNPLIDFPRKPDWFMAQ